MAPRPTVALLAIGDELTLGEKLDTNSKWLADRLGLLGLRVIEHRTVPDDQAVIAAAMVSLLDASEVLIVGGGLGPTADDLTRQSFSDALKRLTGEPQPLIEDEDALRAIESFFRRTGRTMSDANRSQALRPSGAEGLPNDHGTAPGMLARVEHRGRSCVAVCLPGPPREMRPMFERDVAPVLQSLPGIASSDLRVAQVFGLGESELASRIVDLMQRENNPAVGTTASSGMVTCRIRVEPGRSVVGPYDADDPFDAAKEATARIAEVSEGYLVSDRHETLAGTLLREARERGVSISTAESCTGGLIGELLTAEPGSSTAYVGGWVAYSNEMKSRELGVAELDLREHGAVSQEVAMAMARGARERTGADIGLSVTGVAGPDGGTSEKPVGTVWIGVARSDELPSARRFRFMGDRASIRLWSANTALFIGLLAVRDRLDVRLLREARDPSS